MIYKKIIRPILFKFDPEKIHHFVVKCLGLVSRISFLEAFLERMLFVNHKYLHVKVGALEFKNPIGLAAGFDKYIDAPLSYPMLGFGFAELGSITYSPQSGNPKPRMWRLPKDQGLIVNYGLSNDGAKKTKERIVKKIKHRKIPYGVSIAPTTGLLEKDLVDDYLNSFLELYDVADYIVLNVSCPNVVNIGISAQLNFIENLLQKIYNLKSEKQIKKDIFIKIGPEMKNDEIDSLVDICLENKITGIIATNLCKKRENLPNCKTASKILENSGSVSGALIREMSNRTISRIYQKSQGKLVIIGVGGVFSAQDAYRKIRLGASLVQNITGFIYEGPIAIRNINKGLIKLLKNDGYESIGEVVGKDIF